MQENKIYEDRAVLFLDILGFKRLIEESREEVIIEALNVSKEVVEKIDPNKTIKATAFSDCIVVSQSLSNGCGFASIISYASALWLRFLCKGVLIRGGIAAGKLHHTPDRIFGPAMIEAYQLESRIALFPRIVIHPKSLALLYKETHNPEWPSDTTFSFLAGRARRDFDGMYHAPTLQSVLLGPKELIPPASYNNGATKGWTALELHESVAPYVRKIINENPRDIGVASKFDWLSSYLDWSECEAKKCGKTTKEELTRYRLAYESSMNRAG